MSLSTDNSTLSFTSLLPSHGGLYKCVSYKSNNRIVSVGYLLSYVSLSVSISGPDTAEAGKEHTFECKPDCNISCDIYWTFRGGFPAGSFTQQRTVIKWTPYRANITQAFTCVVENNLAKKSAEFTKLVRVVQKPNKKVKPKSGSMALKPSTALCLMFCLGFFLHSSF
ncbi:hypothetical protein GJAV_G00005900 [Gymnothorax javanicus]|nr:hypothetical protein GJAV_G00005900 [Gymnothorax javanicus]